MSPAFLQLMALPWPKLARAALLVLSLVAHAAQACSPLEHGHTSNKHKRSPGDPSVIEEMISNFYYVPPTESLPELLAHSAGLVSTQPHGDSQHVRALTATSGAPIQFQQAGQTGSRYPARFGLDYSEHYFPQSSSAAAAHVGAHSFPLEHRGVVHSAQIGVPTEPASFSRDYPDLAPHRMVHVAQSSHQAFPRPPTAINHAGSSTSSRGAQTTPHLDDALELTKAVHGSASSHSPGTTRKVKLIKPSEYQIELVYKELSASPTILEGLTNAVNFDIDEVRLAAARKVGLEDDARKLLAEGTELMELRRLLERSIQNSRPRSEPNWYVAEDAELRTWLGRVYTLRGIISSFPNAKGRTLDIESHMDANRVVHEVEGLRKLRSDTRRRRHRGELPPNQQLSGIVGPFQTKGAVGNPFVFGSYIFRVLRATKDSPAGGSIRVLPFEPFFNGDELLVGKLPMVAPGTLKDE